MFLSGIQHFAEVPEGMAKIPIEVKEIMKDVPVAWDETKFIDGYPGKYVVIARRKENVWYVAGINGESAERTVKLNLGFIRNPSASLLITCGMNNRSFSIKHDSIDIMQPLQIALKPDDGFLCKVNMK
jgi:hypothetical protein